jgi:Sec-independent protein secretion pathway component TatC
VIEMVPLIVLYELSILLSAWLDRIAAQRAAQETTPDAV